MPNSDGAETVVSAGAGVATRRAERRSVSIYAKIRILWHKIVLNNDPLLRRQGAMC